MLNWGGECHGMLTCIPCFCCCECCECHGMLTCIPYFQLDDKGTVREGSHHTAHQLDLPLRCEKLHIWITLGLNVFYSLSLSMIMPFVAESYTEKWIQDLIFSPNNMRFLSISLFLSNFDPYETTVKEQDHNKIQKNAT